MFRVEWDIKEAIERLTALAGRLSDLRAPFRSVAKYLREQATPKTFQSEGARIGENWQPLSDSYGKWKAIHYPGQPLLRRTDALFRSLTEEGGDNISEVERESLVYGTRNPVAFYQQRGGGRLPRRKILDVTEEDRREIAARVRAHLDDQGRLEGFA